MRLLIDGDSNVRDTPRGRLTDFDDRMIDSGGRFARLSMRVFCGNLRGNLRAVYLVLCCAVQVY